MKPRLFFDMEDRIWVCLRGGTYRGYGFTPRQAWDDWIFVNPTYRRMD